MDKIENTAAQIISICQKDNIAHVYCCITRLRLHFKNKEIVDYDALKALDLVKGIFWFGEECQLVIGLEVLQLNKVIGSLLEIQS